MNKILKAFLETAGTIAKDAASQAIPGAGILIGGVTKLVDKNHDNNAEAIGELEQGLVTALGSIDTSLIKDPMALTLAVTELQDAFAKVKTALGK